MFGVNSDVIGLALKDFDREETFISFLKDPHMRNSIINDLTEKQMILLKDSLSGIWIDLSGKMLSIVIDYILINYLEHSKKITLSEGLVMFHSSEKWILKVKKFLEDSTLLKPRAQIITDALYAHLEGKYNLSVPVFIIQFRGLMDEVSREPSIVQMDSGLVPGVGSVKITGICINVPIKGKGKFMSNTCSEVLQGVETFIYKKRNEILNGYNLNYGTIEMSTELIIFLHIFLLGLGMDW